MTLEYSKPVEKWGNNKTLLNQSRWMANPPTKEDLKAQIAESAPQAHGMISAAYLIANAASDPSNIYTKRDIWGAKNRWKCFRWLRAASQHATRHWPFHWWRACTWPVWDNTRQWLMSYNSGAYVCVRLDKEIDEQHNCLYTVKQDYVGVNMIVRKPMAPQYGFDYIWRKVPKWPMVDVVGQEEVPYPKPIAGKHYRLTLSNGQDVILSRRAHLAAFKLPGQFHAHENGAWIAVTNRYGIAVIASRL